MTNEEFYTVYREMVGMMMNRAEAEDKLGIDDLEYHQTRFMAYQVAISMQDYSIRDLTSMICNGEMPVIQNMDDLHGYLDDEKYVYDDEIAEGSQDTVLTRMWINLYNYFGVS